MEFLIVQSVFDEFFWRIQSYWFVFFVELFVSLRKNTNKRRCMRSGCVFSSLDTSQPKSVVSDLCDSVRWEKKCVWVFSIVVISCWCGLYTSIFFPNRNLFITCSNQRFWPFLSECLSNDWWNVFFFEIGRDVEGIEVLEVLSWRVLGAEPQVGMERFFKDSIHPHVDQYRKSP